MEFNFHWRKANVLFISDMHIPYEHPQAIDFLAALEKKYGFEVVVSVGDLADFHAISFHKSDPDLKSAGEELLALQKKARTLEQIFPEMLIVGSNHGDLPLRKLFDAGLPKGFLKTFNEIHTVGPDWGFIDDLTIKDGEHYVYVAHGISKQAVKVAAQRGVNHVCGHYHTESRIEYVSNPRDLLWGMNTGCLIDKNAMAFAYNKLDLSRPIISTGALIDGQPRIFPMQLSRGGEWTGKVP